MANTRPTLSFEQAAFLKSAAKLSQCPLDVGAEVAFCGRSNAGKSSAINCLTAQRKLARTSKTPGRTQLINFFALTDSTRLVDLPGYGYAKVPEAVKRDWHRNIDDYLQNRHSLKGLILVSDIRHPLKEFDEMMLDWSSRSRVPIHILLTKADKLKRGARQSTFFNVKQKVSDAVTLQVFSSASGIGKNILVQRLSQWLDE